jgi:hypothetical protein
MSHDGKSWRCWHCDEVFADRESAALHFGTSAGDQPGCVLQVNPEGLGLLRALREAALQLAKWRLEDTDLHRTINRLTAEHAVALRREEERGYARGLRDGRELAATE